MISRIILTVVVAIAVLSSACNPDGKRGKEKITVQKKYSQTGKLVSEISVKNGVKHGPTRNYYDNGKLHSVVNYEEGKQQGESVWYYENGKPYQVTPYVDGKQHGIQKKYYQSGRLMAEIPFMNGEQQPGIKEFTETGNLITNYPEIVFEKPSRTASPNRFVMKIHLSNNSKEVLFHQRIVSSTGDTLMASVPTRDGTGEITFFVSKGRSTEADIVIVAKTKTRFRNNYVMEGKTHVKIVN